MLNFRKLKQDFSSNALRQGKILHDKKNIVSAKILKFSKETLKIGAEIVGNFDSTYKSEIEIDRFESFAVHSQCNCSYKYDCKHIAALVFYLEEHINSLIVGYEGDVEEEVEKEIDEASLKEKVKRDKSYRKEVLEEYGKAFTALSSLKFFQKEERKNFMSAEPLIIIDTKSLKNEVEYQLFLRIPLRSKPLQIPDIKQFFDAVVYAEEIAFPGKSYFFSMDSFKDVRKMMQILMSSSFEKGKTAKISFDDFGKLLSFLFHLSKEKRGFNREMEDCPYLFFENLDSPLKFSFSEARFLFGLEYIEPPASKLLINPKISIDQKIIRIDEALLLPSMNPGMVYQGVYHQFPKTIKREHIKQVGKLMEMIIPEPLFGSFVENALPEMRRYADVEEEILDKFITVPYTGKVKGRCNLTFADKELEAYLYFIYDDIEIPCGFEKLSYEHIMKFVSKNEILARNILEEKHIVEDIFQGFLLNEEHGSYVTRSEKKIVEFMTQTLVQYKDKIDFECPKNLLDMFVYDKSKFFLQLDFSGKIGFYDIYLKVEGALKGISLDKLWECMVSKKNFLEIGEKNSSKILVLDLNKISQLVQIFDEMGIDKIENKKIERPLWSIVNIKEDLFKDLPIKFSMSASLKEMQRQILGEKEFIPTKIPEFLNKVLRPYQKEGIHWLERLRSMYLNGILADDMGLGKTLQAIVAISSQKKKSIVVCPTSLLHNWKEEFLKFNKNLKVKVVDGIPSQRKKTLDNIEEFDVVITSYTLMQKDVEQYEKVSFGYAILDEAQHIKNRTTRNAKSVKRIKAAHKLILTGTPIENSLEDLWSLFDFLMPGLLSSYERFSEKYIRSGKKENIEYLKKKASPFILRRMKKDVLEDLPPISEIIYHCKLSEVQEELYKSYARSAKEELSKLVKEKGFKKVQIHVLATLTRLKQICCHPSIFAKEKIEEGDSSKYDMLLELLQTLVEGGHKTVIFSQYTKMLQIMKDDFMKKGISFSYLDGSTKNRLEVVKQFNQDKNIPVFLVSLKAGGVGLNITGADTIIHYDMWWNPAVENQATDRVYRIGQKKSVSCYKLVTLNSIEEKIVELQNRKKGLVKKVISCDDEVINNLTWEDVLKLLQI